jgi:hypothetical protein
MVAITTVLGLLLLDRRLTTLAALAADPCGARFGEPNDGPRKNS